MYYMWPTIHLSIHVVHVVHRLVTPSPISVALACYGIAKRKMAQLCAKVICQNVKKALFECLNPSSSHTFGSQV